MSRATRPGFGNTIAATPGRSLQPMCVKEGDSMRGQVDDAPALFQIELADELGVAEGRIERLGGSAEPVRRDLSLYPRFFSALEAAGIASRMCALE